MKKINFKQNKTKPCAAELRLRSTQVYHAFLALVEVIFAIGLIGLNFLSLVLVSSCGYAVVASRMINAVFYLKFIVLNNSVIFFKAEIVSDVNFQTRNYIRLCLIVLIYLYILLGDRVTNFN